MKSRRSYALTLAACLVGSVLAAYAVTRTWSLQLTPRTGMSDLRTARTGTDAAPWVIGLALVALAGTGALLATRGVVRRVLGVLLTLAGLGVAAGAIVARAGVDPGAAGAGANVWPVVGVLGGLIIVAGGATTVRVGGGWPAMSARYDRKVAAPAPPQVRRSSPGDDASSAGGASSGDGGSSAGGASSASGAPSLEPVDHRAAWDALDRGDDPTG
jgi:tryptophan-associated transmembrane protein